MIGHGVVLHALFATERCPCSAMRVTTPFPRGATNVIGHGVVLHVPGLFQEMAELEAKGVTLDGRLLVSDRAHLLFDMHKEVDGAREAELAGA